MEDGPHTTIEYEVADTDELEDELLFAADRHYGAGRYVDALGLYASALKTNADSTLYFKIANCHNQLKDYEQACRNWMRACQLNSKNYSAHVSLGDLYYKLGETEKAVKYWELGVSINPKDEKTLLNLASVFEKQDRRLESIKYFEHFLQVSNKRNSVNYLEIEEKIGDCRRAAMKYLGMGIKKEESYRYEEAIEYYNNSLSNYPNYYETNKRLGDIYWKKNERRLAIGYWERAFGIEQKEECRKLIAQVGANYE